MQTVFSCESLAGGKFSKFGESIMICLTKTIKIITYNCFPSPNARKESIRQTLPVSLYRVYIAILAYYDSCDTMFNQCSYVRVTIASYVRILPVGLDYFDYTCIHFLPLYLLAHCHHYRLKRNQL